MKLIIGLGNPGKQYENTRHNVGYFVVDKLKAQSLKVKDVVFVKTNVFMNSSGEAVKKLTTNYQLPTTDLYIVHDDLDIPLGQFKIQFGRGPKDHNGVSSVEESLGTKDFWRVRVGIENRVPPVSGAPRVPSGEEYTLQDFLPEEREIVESVTEEVWRSLQKLEAS